MIDAVRASEDRLIETMGDMHKASEDRLVETMRDIQTEMLKAFYNFAESNHRRVARL